MENHLVLYQAGHAGTFLVWLINQHNNFSQYEFIWKYTDKGGHKLDIGCLGADWYHDDETFAESRSKWQGEDGAILNPHMIPHNEKRTKDAIKIIPNHCCQSQLVNFDASIDRRLLKKVIDEINPKSIIIPVASDYLKDELLNRWITYIQNHKDTPEEGGPTRDIKRWESLWWDKTFPWLKENAWRYGDNSHTIDIGKIALNDESEYIKLCEIIDEEPLTNIKEIIEPFRNMMELYK
jgi:hypothetical protein